MRLLSIARSSRPDKKYEATFDVDGRRKTVHFGARGYGDFIEYSAASPALAAAKRRAYLARHGAASSAEDWGRPDTPGSLSRWVLWESPRLSDAIDKYRRRFRV